MMHNILEASPFLESPIQPPIKLESSWLTRLQSEFSKPYMNSLRTFLLQEKATGKTILPQGNEIFAALNSVPFEQVKVVIIGQDPYHGLGQAHGLCFSVKKGVPTPPSLVNIYKELANDVGFKIPKHGFLQSWANQGVLLLNAVLTVELGRAASHQNKGWETFTDEVIKKLAEERSHLVFLLWGSYAQRKGEHIDRTKHLVLKAAHPSPFSAYKGFFGTRHFSQANAYLEKHGLGTIDWQLA